MGLFKKKNTGNTGASGGGSLMNVLEKGVMEAAFEYSINQAKAAKNKQVEGYVKDALLHFQEDCMDLDDVELAIVSLENYTEAVHELIRKDQANENQTLSSIIAMGLVDKMREKRKSML